MILLKKEKKLSLTKIKHKFFIFLDFFIFLLPQKGYDRRKRPSEVPTYFSFMSKTEFVETLKSFKLLIAVHSLPFFPRKRIFYFILAI